MKLKNLPKERKLVGIYSLGAIRKKTKKLIFEYFITVDDLIENRKFRWAPLQFYEAIENQTRHYKWIKIKPFDSEHNPVFNSGLWIDFTIKAEGKVRELLKQIETKLTQLHREIEVSLGQFLWKDAYGKDEKLFSEEILLPLFLRMGFNNVYYNHGIREYGKDFIFSDIDTFDQKRNYAVQVKAGNISGRVNSQVDELIGQIQDAFQMPYFEINSKNPIYISTFIVAISGKFTENAKEKIYIKLIRVCMGQFILLINK